MLMKLSMLCQFKLILNKIIKHMSNISVVAPEAIRKHPLNTSPSKIAHKFSNTPRFITPNPQCPNAFYTYDSHLSHRKAAFGYGTKFDFTKSSVLSPEPTKYNHKSVFEEKGKGKSFGLSRQHSPDQSYLIPQIHKNPGPGQYVAQSLPKETASYTLRPRTLDVIDKNLTYRKSPGPGSYKTIELQPTHGRFFISKFGDGRLAKINPNSPRFYTAKDSPGPLTYHEGDSMNQTARYVLSQRKGHGQRAFDHQARFTIDHWKPSKNPGPGYYEKPSDFGVYGDTKYYKTLGSFK